MSDTAYCYPPDYKVLKNKADIREQDALDRFERRMTFLRLQENIPSGDFDLPHLQAIHRHIFQDVYNWAGKLRTVEINKGSSQFQFRQYIETGMADVHRRIQSHNYLKNLSKHDFADLAGEIMGDVNYVHPFREGNGRTQMQYLKQLTEQAGHSIDLTKIDRDAWMLASKRAHQGDYQTMARCIGGAIGNSRERNQSRNRQR
jgi:cell filamentation protein